VAQSNDEHTTAQRLPEDWQQGDILSVDGLPFFYLADLRNPLMPQSKEFLAGEEQAASGNPFAAVAVDVEKFVIISQTCDLIRDFSDVPTVQLATVEKVSAKILAGVKKRTTIRYLFLPELESESLVANLDQVFTVEKAVLLAVDPKKRKCAVRNDVEAQILSEGITRKYSRFAFPDEFTAALDRFRDFVVGKHHKDNANGKALRAVTEIRVTSSKGWTNKDSEIQFLFLFDHANSITKECEDCIGALMKLFVVNEKFPVRPLFRCLTFEDITADTYRRSQLLDLNFLSGPAK
jgi:hypothetical protein